MSEISYVGQECFWDDKVTFTKKLHGKPLGKCIKEGVHSLHKLPIVWFEKPFLGSTWQFKSNVSLKESEIIDSMDEIERVNEETEDGNYVIEIFNPVKSQWQYVTTEFSISVASIIISNLHNATNQKCRVLSRRSKNKVLAEYGKE